MAALGALAILCAMPGRAEAGKLGALERLLRAAAEESRVEIKGAIRWADEARLVRGGDELFESAARQHDSLLRAAGRVTQLDEAALSGRLARLSAGADAETARTLAAMSAAERRFVVEAAETAGELCRKHPERAAEMIHRLGPEGLSYTRAFGDDVAEIVFREGPESLGVLRRGGRGAWVFFKDSVLPHKKKLAAAGVLTAFMAQPDKFVDMAGRATDFAVREFARAGVELASVVPGALADGMNAGMDSVLARWGMNYAPLRWSLVGVMLLVAAGAAIRLAGLPLRTVAWPVVFALRRFRRPGEEAK